MQSKKQVVKLGIITFENQEKKVELYRSIDQVRKKRPPSYLGVATWTLIYYLLLHFSRIYYKSEKMSGQTVLLIKIKTVPLFYLIMVA